MTRVCKGAEPRRQALLGVPDMTEASKGKDADIIPIDDGPKPIVGRFKDGAHDPDPDLEDVEFSIGRTTYQFGELCQYTYCKNPESDDPEMVDVPFARNVWPLALYQHVDDDEFGVRFTYRRTNGDLAFSTIHSGAFTDDTAKRRAAREQSKQGVHIFEGQGKAFGRAMGAVRDYNPDLDVVRVTSTPGWHEDGNVYVNGDHYIAGGEDWYADEQAPSIKRRSTRRGSAKEWSNRVEKLATTPGLRTAIAVAMAGPLVDYITGDSFTVHFCGASSIGKSRASKLGASLWGDPQGIVDTWDSTEKALSGLAKMADGSCLFLDEMGEFDEGPKALNRAAYHLVADKGRSRMHVTGELRETPQWRITSLSTGEQSMKSRMGRFFKGGHAVRLIDVRVSAGELTTDAKHADRIDTAFTGRQGQYGHAGDAWVSYLVNLATPADVESSRDRWREYLDTHASDDDPEGGRILSSLALLGAALEHGREADLLPWGDDTIADTLEWLASKVMTSRQGMANPKERALQLLWDLVDTKRAHYPELSTVKDDRTRADIWGIRMGSGDVLVSEALIELAGIDKDAGVGARDFLRWAVNEGHAEKVNDGNRKSYGGIRRRWYRFNRGE